jgi:nucleoside-diphosphate-sugar epimerase
MTAVLVTGYSGFIGSHLVERLLKLGYKVIGVDNFNDNYSKERKLKNIESFSNDKNFISVNKDLNDCTIEDFEAYKIKYVIHLAGQPGVRDSWGIDFNKYVHNNITATQNLLDLLIRLNSVEKLIYGSSSSVYGNASKLPTTEDVLPAPVSPYGVTKLAGENLCFAYSQNYNFNFVALRFFTVYGPRQRPDMFIMKLIKKALTDEEVVIFGDGTQKRDFTFISDIIDGIVAAISKGSSVYNLARGETVSLKEVCLILKDLLGNIKIKFDSTQKGDVHCTWGDITRSRKELDYNPSVDLYQGLVHQVNWAKENLSWL